MATLALRQPLLHRVSWGGLFAGFFFGFGIWMLLLALGAGVGIAAFDPRDLGSWQGLGIGFGIWGVIAGIIGMFVAGWFTARMSASDTKLAGMLHGCAVWGFMLVAGLWIATMAIGRTAATAAQAAAGAAQGAAAGVASDESARGAMREQAEQARRGVQGLAQQAQPEEAAGAAKRAGATGAWAFFLYGVLTLAAAIFGGRAGVPEERAITREATVPPGEPVPHRV